MWIRERCFSSLPCVVGLATKRLLESRLLICLSLTQAPPPRNEVGAPKFVPRAFSGERISCSKTTSSWSWKPRWKSSMPFILVQTERNHTIILRLKTIPWTRHRYLWNLTQVQLLLRNQWSWPPLVRWTYFLPSSGISINITIFSEIMHVRPTEAC